MNIFISLSIEFDFVVCIIIYNKYHTSQYTLDIDMLNMLRDMLKNCKSHPKHHDISVSETGGYVVPCLASKVSNCHVNIQHDVIVIYAVDVHCIVIYNYVHIVHTFHTNCVLQSDK